MATISSMSLAKGDVLTTAHMYAINRANDGYGYITGCDVHQKASPGMGVTIDSGSIIYNGGYVAVSGGDVVIDTANATYPRMDIIYINGSGTAAVVKGVAAAILPTSETAFKKMTTPYPNASIPTGVILARVYVAAGATSILDASIDDIAMQLTQVPLGILTTRGDIPFRGTNTWERLAKGTTNYRLTQGTNDPQWTVGTFGVNFPFGNGATVLTAEASTKRIPITSKITKAYIRSLDTDGALKSGSITITIYVHDYNAAIGSSVDSFVLSSASSYEETGLSITVDAGKYITAITSGITTCEQVTLDLELEAT